MKCNAKPYEGQDRYIFISYCHEDKHVVYPIIEQMSKDGYRVWYDEGITPGSEWAEVIAKHLDECTIFILFITNNSVNSHNCRREAIFAMQKKKALRVVFLEDTKLSLGMQMIFSNVQQLNAGEYKNNIEWLQKIYKEPIWDWCKGEANPNIVVQLQLQPTDNSSTIKHQYGLCDEIFLKNKLETNESSEQDEACEDEETIILSQQFVEKQMPTHYLLRLDNGEKIELKDEEITIGRAKTDTYETSYDKTTSRGHAVIETRNGDSFLRDNESLNHVFLNGDRIPKKKKILLEQNDVFYIGKTAFMFLTEQDGSITPKYFLETSEGNTVLMSESICTIGRKDDVCDLHIQDKSASMIHAVIAKEKEHLIVVDLRSTNGTYMNDVKIKSGGKRNITMEDRLSFGRVGLNIRKG